VLQDILVIQASKVQLVLQEILVKMEQKEDKEQLAPLEFRVV
jgi:hypothetical protein